MPDLFGNPTKDDAPAKPVKQPVEPDPFVRVLKFLADGPATEVEIALGTGIMIDSVKVIINRLKAISKAEHRENSASLPLVALRAQDRAEAPPKAAERSNGQANAGNGRTAPHNGTDGSREAALLLDPEWRETACGRVYWALRDAPDGLTREQIAEACAMPIQTVCARVADLRRGRSVEEREGVTRQTRAGIRAAVVFAIVK